MVKSGSAIVTMIPITNESSAMSQTLRERVIA